MKTALLLCVVLFAPLCLAETLTVQTFSAGPNGVYLRIEGGEWYGLGAGNDSVSFDLGDGVSETTLYWGAWDEGTGTTSEVGMQSAVIGGVWSLDVPSWTLTYLGPGTDPGTGGELSIDQQIALFWLGAGCVAPLMVVPLITHFARRARMDGGQV